MRIIFATWAAAEYQGRILTEEGARDRLVSFWEMLTQKDPRLLGLYVEKGKAGKMRGVVNE